MAGFGYWLAATTTERLIIQDAHLYARVVSVDGVYQDESSAPGTRTALSVGSLYEWRVIRTELGPTLPPTGLRENLQTERRHLHDMAGS